MKTIIKPLIRKTALCIITAAFTIAATIALAAEEAKPVAGKSQAKANAPDLPLYLQSDAAAAKDVYVLAVDFECTDPAQTEAFDKWYAETYLPGELTTPGFQAAWRVRTELPLRRYVKGPGDRAGYLTLFEVHTGDIAGVLKAHGERLKKAVEGKGPGQLLKEVNAIAYRSMGAIHTRANTPVGPDIPKAKHPASEVEPTGKLKRYVLATETNTVDPAKEKEFNKWYDTVHIPDVLAAPGYRAAWRLEIVTPVEGRGKFLTLYEIHTDNLRATIDTRDERKIRENMVGAYEGANVAGYSQGHYVTLGEKVNKAK